ncbi:MAG: DUF262 domain-containing protein [Selenomonadaceae bacterium]|nr:DUF262 domain-containing protein [Selenomonadaceae bacterium]
MAKQLNAEQKTISQIFTDPKIKFLIPDYQRSYSWEREQCGTLWDDICSFAFPLDHTFDADSDRYFLGTILTFQNSTRESEVIDGQQRLITFLLMLRAFYQAFENIQCKNKENILASIGQCIWKTDEFRNIDKTSVKLNSEVASDEDVAEFKKILATGEATPGDKSNYAENYRYFKEAIEEFKKDYPENFSYLPMRILNNCILLPIEADGQNTALRIFTTLNDRGMPLSDADIFKAQFYKIFSREGKQSKEKFVRRWKDLNELCDKNFHPRKGTPVDDLFMRYMYYAKTKRAIKADKRISDTFSNMRDFYSEGSYEIFQSEESFEDLVTLANFWDDVAERNEKFSSRVLKKFYILDCSPYSVWSNVVSLYFMSNRDSENNLEEEKFCAFLDKVTAMILMNAISESGTQNIRRPFVLEFKDIFHGEPLEFDTQFKPQEKIFCRRLTDMRFSNNKKVTRMMLTWWLFRDGAQELPPLGMDLHIEHIFAKKRQELHNELRNPDALEFLGNKSLLEKTINIRASDYRIVDKKIYYLGDGKSKTGSFNLELQRLAKTHDDFTEEDILERNEEIFNAFIDYLRENDLLL